MFSPFVMTSLPHPLRPSRRRLQRGFTLTELSVVLVVIGLILGAVAVGKDVQRNAAYQRVSTEFVQGWLVGYDTYTSVTGRVPGDSAAAPTGAVNATVATAAAAGTALCDNPANAADPASLLNVFLAAGVQLPQGRAEGLNNRYVYLDTNGNPQELRACLQNVMWAEPGATVGTYVSRPRNVLVLSGLTPSLARLIDSQIDTQADARFGRVRQDAQANAVATSTGQEWSIDERMAYGGVVATARDESQVAVTTAYILMNR
jgi:prepilin-type N-terminal cleavage/methylation domain-containing protein